MSSVPKATDRSGQERLDDCVTRVTCIPRGSSDSLEGSLLISEDSGVIGGEALEPRAEMGLQRGREVVQKGHLRGRRGST